MLNISRRDGTVLLQTMIICLLLAYVSISVTKWVLQRYTGVINTYRGSMARGTTGGGADRMMASWIFGTPSGSRLDVDNKRVDYSYSAISGGVYSTGGYYGTTGGYIPVTLYKVAFTYEPEQSQ